MSDAAQLLNGRTDVIFANASDTGCVRSVNEDYYLFIEPADETEFQRRGRLVVVADGMGGHKGGRVASRLAADTIRDVFLATTEDDPLTVLRDGFEKAHLGILEMGSNDSALQGMGTTCTAIILRGLNLAIGHIGDSRLYLIRGGCSTRLSCDHTLVNDMLASGLITAADAATHEKKHVLSAAMGASPELRADFIENPVALTLGDILLLCTDGLHGLISDEEIVSATNDQSLSEACSELLAWAKVRGGPDNITLQMIRIETASSPDQQNRINAKG